MRLLVCLLLIALLQMAAAAPAGAQSVSGVSGSDVKAGEDVFEYRFAFAPDNDGREEAFTHRFHYQHGFSGKWRGRALLLMGNRGGDAVKTQAVGFEVLHQFLESEATGGWDSAIRADVTISTVDGRSDRARIGWHNSIQLSERMELRAILLLGKDFGDNPRDGVSIETREEATYKLNERLRVGIQAFNNFNTTAHVGSFDEQRHQVGPILKGRIGDRVRYEASALFGISDDPTDLDARFFVSYAF